MMIHAFKEKLEAGSARVFNCLDISTQLANDNPNAVFLFQNPGLNRFIFLKDVVLDWQDDQNPMAPRPISTKAYWPFDSTSPGHGGESVFSFEENYVDLLQTKVGPFGDDWRRDRLILGVLQELPGFDPFLLKDRMTQLGISADPAYFNISHEEWLSVREHLRARLEPWVTVAYGRQCPEFGKSDLVIDRIWLHQDESHFFPLKKLLRMSHAHCLPLLDAWKGVAYFQVRYEALLPRIRALAEWLGMAPNMIDGVPCLSWRELQGVVNPLRRRYRDCWGEVMAALEAYDEACSRVYRYRHADDFILFLNNAPTHFNNLGRNLGMLQDMVQVWDMVTNNQETQRLPPRSWLMLVRDFVRILS